MTPVRGPLAAKGSVGAALGVTAGGATALPCYWLSFDGTDYGTFVGIALTPPCTIVGWTWADPPGGVWMSNGIDTSMQMASLYVPRVTWDGTNADDVANRGAGVWLHVAGVFRTSLNQIDIYTNGVYRAKSGAYAAGLNTINCFGAVAAGVWPWFGRLAAVGIAPNEQNIAALWAAGSFHKPLDPLVWTVLAMNLRNEGGAGGVADDESASTNDCTFALAPNAPAWGGTMAATGPLGWTD